MSDVILEARNLTKAFKGFTAVAAVNLQAQRGHIHALIGPNGAGKTTCFNFAVKAKWSPCWVEMAPVARRSSAPSWV